MSMTTSQIVFGPAKVMMEKSPKKGSLTTEFPVDTLAGSNSLWDIGTKFACKNQSFQQHTTLP